MLSRKQQFRMICRHMNSNSYEEKLNTRIMQFKNNESENESDFYNAVFDTEFLYVLNKMVGAYGYISGRDEYVFVPLLVLDELITIEIGCLGGEDGIYATRGDFSDVEYE